MSHVFPPFFKNWVYFCNLTWSLQSNNWKENVYNHWYNTDGVFKRSFFVFNPRYQRPCQYRWLNVCEKAISISQSDQRGDLDLTDVLSFQFDPVWTFPSEFGWGLCVDGCVSAWPEVKFLWCMGSCSWQLCPNTCICLTSHPYSALAGRHGNSEYEDLWLLNRQII